jgi:hypothetical protein
MKRKRLTPNQKLQAEIGKSALRPLWSIPRTIGASMSEKMAMRSETSAIPDSERVPVMAKQKYQYVVFDGSLYLSAIVTRLGGDGIAKYRVLSKAWRFNDRARALGMAAALVGTVKRVKSIP